MNQLAYPINFYTDFAHLHEWEGFSRYHRICVVTDTNVRSLYGLSVQENLENCCEELSFFCFPAGEEQKNLETVSALYDHLLREELDRRDLLAALGGGVVGDLTGFAASTYKRGIDFIQLPTTLLSQVDSSIGGKTGVDFHGYKNMIGAFYQPQMVYMNMNTLKTLDEEQFSCGMGEVLKYGLIRDASFSDWLFAHTDEILSRDPSVLAHAVDVCCAIKADVVAQDPFDRGLRAILNFGHTIGHAIEKRKDFQLTHGHCVALGMIAAAYISYKKDYISSDALVHIQEMNVAFGLPAYVYGIDSRKILETTRSDKKMERGKIHFVLLREIGEAFVSDCVTEDEVLAAIDFINGDLTDGKRK